jgi:hypothetical protein
MREEKAARKAANPLYDRLAVIDDLLEENQQKLKRALDPYLSGGIIAEMLTEFTER